MFRFKQFEVDDSLCAMKVGTDGVLLGAWADVARDSRIVDLGTGSGLIALMLAQRNENAMIKALDIDEGAVAQTRYNVERSAWQKRISVVRGDACEFYDEMPYDHIVSNPPFFTDSIPSPDASRATARHCDTLNCFDIVEFACRNLRDGGRISLILPYDQAQRMRMRMFGRLWLVRQTEVITKCGEMPKRVLLEFIRANEPQMPRCDSLAIYDDKGTYTDEYRLLTEEFYLKF